MGAPKLKSKPQAVAVTSEVSKPQVYDNNPFWQSTLFSDVYLRNDVPNKYRDVWEHDSSGAFYTFCERFRELCDELQGETFENWTERTTINRFIKPVLQLLGWANSRQDPWIEDESFSVNESGETRTYKPDFVIVNDPKQLKYIERETGIKKVNVAREESIISVEAKYWGRIDEFKYSSREDKDRADKKGQVDSTRSMDFDEQCLKYVEILHHDYGILTDGRTWRLFHSELSSGIFKRCYQFNLGNLIKHVQAGLDKKGVDYLTFIDNAKYFYHLFSKSALYNPDGRRFVDDLISDSKKYSDQIEEDLKLRFVSAMSIACNGFRTAFGKAYTSEKLDLLRSTAESHLFTILFVRYCESRNILPIRQNPDYRIISLSNMIDKLDLFNPDKEIDDLNTPILQRRFKDQFPYTPQGTELHSALLDIVDILQNGFEHPAAKFSIAGFKQTVFSSEELSFTKKHKITNREFVKLLFELTYIEDTLTGKYQQIAYSFFAPRQLGSIYESFLEFRLDEAEADLAFIKKKWVSADINSMKIKKMKVPTVTKRSLFFTPDNAERKATGSYYTPDCVVQFILDNALGGTIQGKSAAQLLSIKLCDPAMGSGHFLSGALDYLAKRYIQKLDDEATQDLDLSLVDAKREILHHCIHGVDINPRAVKLAKMSLWLESAAANKSLEPLDDQIKCANSLVDQELWFKEWQAAKHGFDAVIGNPPYLGEKGHKEVFQEIAKGWLGQRFYLGKMDLFYFFFHLALDILKPNGNLGFITTNYYVTAGGARKLRKDLKSRSSISCLVNLNEVRVFGDASGQHNLITILSNGHHNTNCKVMTTDCKDRITADLLRDIGHGSKGSVWEIPQSELYDGDDCYVRISGSHEAKHSDEFTTVIDKFKAAKYRVGDLFNVNQGLHTGADKLSKRHLDKYKIEGTLGEGIFVLTTKEVEAMRLPEREKAFLKPLYKNSDIEKYVTKKNPDLWFIDISYPRDKNLNLKTVPNLIKHLNRFKDILENRVDSSLSTAKKLEMWWVIGLRKQIKYEGPKIVVPQRSRWNTFGYNSCEWFAASDVFFITSNSQSSVGLEYLLGILNSKTVFVWLYFMGKKKGEMLELTQTPVSEIPLPIFDKNTVDKIASLTKQLIEKPSDFNRIDELENIIFDALDFSKKERAAIVSLYESRKSEYGNESKSEEEDDSAA